MVQSCTRDPTGELRSETRIGRSVIHDIVYCKSACIYIAIWYATTPDNRTRVPMIACMYYAPNGALTANDAAFYKNKVG